MVIRMNARTPVPNPEEAAVIRAGSSQSEAMIRAIQHLAAAERRSSAEMLHELRRAFPHSPLAVRVRALEALRRR
jgi:hypothetical protein